jgi:hypothetical protein
MQNVCLTPPEKPIKGSKFFTFGSHANYIDAGKRLLEQANNLNLFEETILYTSDDLKNDKYFWEKHGDFIEKNKRGYGYWIWKSYLIKKTIEKMKDGDILLYLDCGCEINIEEKEYLLKCFETVKKDKLIGTTTGYAERLWNKMDLVKKLNTNIPLFMNTRQHQSGALLILVCDKTRFLMNEWYNLSCDYHNIDDSPSIEPNINDFKEHRHDQSVLSLLCKKYNLPNVTLQEKCIKTMRNRSGNTKL